MRNYVQPGDSLALAIPYPDVPSFDVCAGVRADTLEIDFSPTGPAMATIKLVTQGSVRSGATSGGSPITAAYTAFNKAQGSITWSGAALTADIVAVAKRYGRYGYRRITALLRDEGWAVNRKRVERIWCQEGLRVPQRQPKRGRLWLADGPCVRLRQEHANHVWAYDFVEDRTRDGRKFRMLCVVDEFTRKALAIRVARKLSSSDVIDVLADLFIARGAPAHIRSDQGPEFVAEAVKGWIEGVGARTAYIEKASPWENGYVESFNGKLRDKLLNGEVFNSLREAQVRSTALPGPVCVRDGGMRSFHADVKTPRLSSSGRAEQPRSLGRRCWFSDRRPEAQEDGGMPGRLGTGLASLVLLAATVPCLTAPPAAAQTGTTTETVRARGAVRCGVSTGFPGFAAPDARGEWRGLDVDACRAVAAAVLGDAAKVQYVPLTAVQRLPALTSGEVDMLARNTTFSLGRATAQAVNFVATNYYDGTGFMVRAAGNARTLQQLDGSTVCIQPGTETGLAVQDAFRRRGLRFAPLMIEQVEQLFGAYLAGRCDAVASDQTQLAGMRARAPDASAHLILPDLVSKEPLTVAVRYGDDRWANVVRWSVWAMIEAEELSLSSGNVAVALRESADPAVQRFLGRTGDLGQGMGLDNAWAARIVAQVGNYAESFERNVAPLGIERGMNRLWRDGGLLIAPPFR